MATDYSYTQEGSLGLELVESETGWPVLKTKGSGQSISHKLYPKDVLTSINGSIVYHHQFKRVLNMLRQCGRPVTLSFLRCTTPAQRLTYLGESASNVGAFGMPPTNPNTTPTNGGRDTDSAAAAAPPPPANKPNKNAAPPPPANKPSRYDDLSTTARPNVPNRPNRTRTRNRSGEGNGGQRERESQQSSFSVPPRRGGGRGGSSNSTSNGFSVPPRRGKTPVVAMDTTPGNPGFTVPPRRGGIQNQPKEDVKVNKDGFKIPSRRKVASGVVVVASGGQRNTRNVVKRDKVIVTAVQNSVQDGDSSDTNKKYDSVDMYAGVTGQKFAAPPRRNKNSSGGQPQAKPMQVKPKPTKQGFYGMATAPSEDIGIGSVLDGNGNGNSSNAEVVQIVVGSQSHNRTVSQLDARSGRPSQNPKTPRRPNRENNVASSLGRHGSDLFKQSLRQGPLPDPKPKNEIGSIASALGGLMADLDSAMSRATGSSTGSNTGSSTGSNTGSNTGSSSSGREAAPPPPPNKPNNSSSSSSSSDSFNDVNRRRVDPLQVTEDELAPPLKLTRSMIFGKKTTTMIDSSSSGSSGGSGSGSGSTMTSSSYGSTTTTPSSSASFSTTLTTEAIFPFVAEQSDELSFNKNDTIYDVTEKDEDWYYGYIRGKKGAFPKAYVKTISTNGRRTKWKFDSEHSDELSFPENAIVECIEEKDDEWSWGTYHGERGVFPTSYMGEIATLTSATAATTTTTSASNVGGYVSGSLSSDTYVPGQFSSGASDYSYDSTSNNNTSSNGSSYSSGIVVEDTMSPMEKAQQLLKGLQGASDAADAVNAVGK